MTWTKETSCGNESAKIRWEAAPYLRGRGLDLGAGECKVLPHTVSVDNCHHNTFGYNIRPDVFVETAENLDVFASASMDFVYSSHLLEHMERPKKCLAEWWRVVKRNGYLILYTPHDAYYPKVGEDGANPDHKFNLNNDIIIKWMEEVCDGWDLVENQVRSETNEYSAFQVFQKVSGRNRRQQSWNRPAGERRVLVCRFGAVGDLIQASSVFAGLKQQGWEVTLMCSPPQYEVITNDPNIDRLMVLDRDQIPNQNLGEFWAWQAKKYDKFINLSESVEGTLLAMPGRAAHWWAPEVRHSMLNKNYLEFQHELAGIPHTPQVKFFPTDEEREWARKERKQMRAGFVVMWCLAGSSVHKTWAGLDSILKGIMNVYPAAHVVLVGGAECSILEAGWENEPRVHKTSGKWSIRQTLSFLDEVDLVVGPETGVLNATSCMELPKIVLLSHSSWENLTRDWVNTISIWSDKTECPGRGKNVVPACHQMHYGWEYCKKDEESGTAQCQIDISIEEVWHAIARVISSKIEMVA